MQVESGIPIPRTFPFGEMKIGDSFVIPPHIKRTTVSVAAKRYGERYGMTFTTKKMSDGTIRCWRTE